MHCAHRVILSYAEYYVTAAWGDDDDKGSPFFMDSFKYMLRKLKTLVMLRQVLYVAPLLRLTRLLPAVLRMCVATCTCNKTNVYLRLSTCKHSFLDETC